MATERREALSVVLLVVFAFSVSWIWTALGLVLRTPTSVQWVSVLILFILTFASNVFVDPKTMPGWLHTVVGYNPVTHLVSAIRDLMAGTVPAGHIAWLLVGCVALVAVFAPITMRFYRNKE